LEICLFVSTEYTNVTDGQTDRQTDTALIRIPEHDGRTYRQTGGQTYRQMNIQTDKIAISISRVSVLTRDKNVTHQCRIAICKVNWILGASRVRWLDSILHTAYAYTT